MRPDASTAWSRWRCRVEEVPAEDYERLMRVNYLGSPGAGRISP